MNAVADVRKAFEGSLRRIDELTEGMQAERDRIKAESERHWRWCGKSAHNLHLHSY